MRTEAIDKALPSVWVLSPSRPPGPALPLPQPRGAAAPRRAEGSPPGRRHPSHRAGDLSPWRRPARGSIPGRKRKAAGALRRAGEESPPPARSIPKGGILAGGGDPPAHSAGPAPLRSGRWPGAEQALPAAWEGGRLEERVWAGHGAPQRGCGFPGVCPGGGGGCLAGWDSESSPLTPHLSRAARFPLGGPSGLWLLWEIAFPPPRLKLQLLT